MHDDGAGAVPRQHLHRVAAFADEHEKSSGPRLALHPLADDATESLVPEPHVDRLERHVDR